MTVTITDVLLAEHRLLRAMMTALGRWLSEPEPEPVDALRERAVMLAVAVEAHVQREEQQLLIPLRACSENALRLADLMMVVHDEVRELFEQVADRTRDPRHRLWTILQLIGEHFVQEETQVFPMAESLLPQETLTQLAEDPADLLPTKK